MEREANEVADNAKIAFLQPAKFLPFLSFLRNLAPYRTKPIPLGWAGRNHIRRSSFSKMKATIIYQHEEDFLTGIVLGIDFPLQNHALSFGRRRDIILDHLPTHPKKPHTVGIETRKYLQRRAMKRQIQLQADPDIC